jgi:hypothetical protein
MKTLKHLSIILSFLLVVLFVGYMVSDATTHTATGTQQNTGKFGYWLRFTHSFTAGALDTVYMPFQLNKGTKQDPALIFVVGTKDTAVIGLKLQVSVDNSKWSTVAVGTDSTTWANKAAVYNAVVINVNSVTGSNAYVNYIGVFPYYRIMIYGTGTNTVRSDVRVDVLDQN